MVRIIVKSKVGSDGVLHLDLPVGQADADKDVLVTVEPSANSPMCAADLLNSGLVGIWAGRTDISDSREYARRLREESQVRRRDA